MLVDEIQKLMDIYAMILACMYSVLPSYRNLVNYKSLKRKDQGLDSKRRCPSNQ